MYNCFVYRKRLLTVFAFLITKSSFCQLSSQPSFFISDSLKFKKSNIGIEVTASILPQAKITRQTGNYILRSRLQSSYDIGLNYYFNSNKKIRFSTGLHFVVGKRNFFANIPSEDINNWDGRNIIENKELWSSFRIPLLIEKIVSTKKKMQLLLKAGLNLRYGGHMLDESLEYILVFSSTQSVRIFNAELSARNNSLPWVTFLAGLSKSIILDNKNSLEVTIQTDISTKYFIKGDYMFTIPNKPVTIGEYKINGSSLGLSFQYILTGANKQLVKPVKAIKMPDTVVRNKQFKREKFLDTYIFKGNHIQFNFAILSTLKARLKNLSGNHPVSASAAPGLLLSFKYQKNFNNEYSLITGAEAMLAGRNFNTSFSKNDFSPPLVSDYNTKGNSLIQDLILSLPVLIEKRWLYSNTKFLFADGGLRLNFSLGADLDIYSITLPNTANGFYQVAGVDVYANNDAKPWISFPINAGHAWLLKNNNLLQLAICSNISFTKYVSGTYYVDIPNQSLTEGNYSSTGSFIGLSLNYVFTNANYRIRKAYEKTEVIEH